MANERLNELHLAMGEFLTECAHLENIMMSLAIACQLEKKSFDAVHLQFLDLTFGQKIRALKDACAEYEFSDQHRPHLEQGLSQLDVLLPKRNFIVHGTTYEIGMGSGPVVAYRIGAAKKNIDYLNEFIKAREDAAHSFTAEQVRRATQGCIECRGELASVVIPIMKVAAKTHPDQIAEVSASPSEN